MQVIASNQATQEGKAVNSRMVFSNRFRETLSSRTQRTSEPAATAAAVKTMMRCVVACGLLLGGLQLSTVTSISFCEAGILSGKGTTESSDRIQKKEEFADKLPFAEPEPERCFDDFVKGKHQGNALENVPGVQLPLPRWDWLMKEIGKGVDVINDWNKVKIHRFLSMSTLSPCTLNGLEVAVRQKFEKQLNEELDKPQKTVIVLLIEAAFNFRPQSSKKKRGFKKFKHNLSNIFTSCDKSSGLWEYLKNFEMWEEEREDICRRIN